jgi:hypothetical protein
MSRPIPLGDGEAPFPAALAGRVLLHVASETLALGCLFERHGNAYIRIPVHRRQQMPGCEWHCRRVGGLLRSVSYTFERLDHWIALAREAPDRVAGLYRAILNRPDLPEADLTWRTDVYRRGPEGYSLAFRAGSYNPLNVWNTLRGAVHLNGRAEAGFEDRPVPAADAGLLRLANGAPARGLLFLDGRDRTADLLRTVWQEGAAGPMRLEVSAPEGEEWSLDALVLPDGERFTPLGLFLALEDGAAAGGWDTGSPAAQPVAAPFLPGRLVTEALLRQARFPVPNPVLA